MTTKEILAQLDAEIVRLQEARKLLSGDPGPHHTEAKVATAARPRRATRKLSAEARTRIAAAQKKRWAKLKKSTK